jgi:peptide-methionine (S)-S-oxide reductase
VLHHPIATTIEPLVAFYPAEAHHQNYVACNPHQPYIRSVALPKVAKVRGEVQGLAQDAAASGFEWRR